MTNLSKKPENYSPSDNQPSSNKIEASNDDALEIEIVDEARAGAPADSKNLVDHEIDQIVARVRNGDLGAPLEPAVVRLLAALCRQSKADYTRVRSRLKAANKGVSLSDLDKEVHAALADANTAPTHHGYASDIVDRLTVDGFRPVGHEGAIYVVDRSSCIWQRREHDHLERLVAETHDGSPNCKRRPDYIGIAQHAISLVSNAAFFSDAPIGLACLDGFHRVVGSEWLVEPLTPAHRQRVMVHVAPRDQATPLFDEFLHETFKCEDPEEERQQVALVQEIAGATMLGLMPRHHKAVLFYDPFGRAGKGTLESILRHLVPAEFVTAVSPFVWNREYFVVTLSGARLNVVGELPDNEPIPAAIFKSVIGGDLITGRNPTHRPIAFKNEAAHVFMSNHMISSRDQSEAFFARWIIVEFPNSRLRSGLPLDPLLASRIVDGELPGIASWALKGATRLLANNGFSSSAAHDRLMTQWRRGNSSLEEFIHECCDLDVTQQTRRAVLYQHYTRWCGENGRKPFAKSRVKEMLAHNVGLGVTLASLDGYEIFRGIRLKPDEIDFDSMLNY